MMKCSKCQHFNDVAAKFCAQCATPLSLTCSRCGHQLPPSANFCPQCAQPTGLPGGAARSFAAPETYAPKHLAEKILNSRAGLEGERKQVTVLFADLKSSMELLAGRDPEEARKLLNPVLELMMEAVHHYEGTVNQAAGDGIMALFGAPLAHEDHAVRACYAALRMQERARRHAEAVFHTHGVNLEIRVGLNSGEVVVGTVGSDLRMDYTAVGRTTHLAARMEQLASPGSILMTPATFRLVQDIVTVRPLGALPIKGLVDLLEVYELTRAGLAQSRFEAVAIRGLTGLVGREAELATLERALKQAADGDGCVVGVVADAGVGKSRLCFEFAESCRARGMPVLTGRGLAHSRTTPYLGVINSFKAYCGIEPGDSSEQGRAKISKRLSKIDFGFEGALPLLLDFVGLAEPGSERLQLDPETRRERLHAMFRPLLRAAVEHRPFSGPAVILVEDLHWIDPGSESLLEVQVGVIRDMKCLLVVNFRPGYAAPWMKGHHYEQISLAPLNQQDADTLAARLLGDDPSVNPLLPLIADRAGGNPLFIEELVRKFAESGHLVGERGAYLLSRVPDPSVIPETVQAIIGARIDARDELERSVLQGAAVIGREFTDELLVCLTGKSSAELRPVLRDLCSARLVSEMSDGQRVWAFKHPMMQEVAYRSMLSDRRQSLHRIVAAELQKRHPEPDGTQASLVAYHWEEAGDIAQAIHSNMKAAAWYGTGDAARPVEWERMRDPARALDAWKQIHRLLTGLSLEGPARYRLLLASGRILNFGWREGLTAADLEPYYVEALEMARSLGDTRAIVLLNVAYGHALAGSGSANDYLAVVNEALGMSASEGHVSLAILLTAARCDAYMQAGDLGAALADNDYVLANLHQLENRDAREMAHSPPVWMKYMRGRILTLMGRYDEVRSLLDELIASDDETIHAGHRIRAHWVMTNIALGLNEYPLAKEHGIAARRLAHSNRARFFRGVSRFCTGLELIVRGDHRKAIAMLRDVPRSMRNRGLEGEVDIRCHIAHAQLRAGLFDASRATAEEAADAARRHGNKIWLAYAEWLLEGPDSLTFRKLIKETGAEHFMRLRHPRHERPN